MTNTPGEDRPDDAAQEPGTPPAGPQPGYWEQQAAGQGHQPPPAYPPYGQGYPPGYYPPPAPYAPDHPKATTVLVLGILGVVMCQVIAPFAWVMGRRTVAEIDASGGALGGRGSAQAGYVLGIVGTVLLGLSVLFLAAYLVVVLVLIGAPAFDRIG